MKRNFQQYFPGFFPIEKLKTDYNYLEVNKRRGRLVLDSRSVNYSFGALHKVFQEAFKRTAPQVSSYQKALILGFGAGSIAHILQKELGFQGKITGVEIDAQVVELARKYFRLNDIRNLNLHTTDAFNFVSVHQQSYNLIVVDVFIDHYIPKKFDQIEFLNRLNCLLKKRGILLYNRISNSFRDKIRMEVFRKSFYDVFKTSARSDEFKIGSRNIIFYVNK